MLADAKNIGIWGFGKEGKATLDFIRARRPEVPTAVLGDSPSPPSDLPPDVNYLGGAAATAAIAEGGFDLMVKSPGISIIRPEIAAARAQGTEFTSGTNLWFEHRRKGLVIGITGTKGKSTVATLATQLLRNAGKDVRLLGNTGTPALSQSGGEDVTVLELSSYQLADLDHAPDIGAINNLFPEHVPWHGTLERYYADKLRIATLDPAIPIVANHRNLELRARLAGRAHVIWSNSGTGYAAGGGELLYGGTKVEIEGPLPGGDHNLSNLAIAAATVHALGLLDDPLKLDLTGYVELPHRQQVYATSAGINCVDDSISTVPEATAAALARFASQPIHLLLGGSDRGQNYTALIDSLPQYRMAGVFLLPETGHALQGVIKERLTGVTVLNCDDLDHAMREVSALARSGDCVLLSPGAPSFVQFANFEERGERFVALCSEAFGQSSLVTGA